MKTKTYMKVSFIILLMTTLSLGTSLAQRGRTPSFKNGSERNRTAAFVTPHRPEVGDTLYYHIKTSKKDTFSLQIYKDTILLQTLTVYRGATPIVGLSIGKYLFKLFDSDTNVVDKEVVLISIPKVRSHISPPISTIGDTVSLKVDASSTELFTLTIYKDTVLVKTLTVTGGTSVLPSFSTGKYNYELTNSDGYTVSKGKFVVNGPKVHSRITPYVSTVGDTISIKVDAATAESFILSLYSDSLLIQSLAVSGGATILPNLTVGRYSYSLTNEEGYVVDKGRFVVQAPKVKSFIAPSTTFGDTLYVRIKADSTASFSLKLYTVDSSGINLTNTLTVVGGKTQLPLLPIGFYFYELVNGDGYTVDAGRFVVKVPKIVSKVAPNPSLSGQGFINVNAPISETFTFNIYGSSTLVSTQNIPGGTSALPSLEPGVYYYHVINGEGHVVSKGRIIITL